MTALVALLHPRPQDAVRVDPALLREPEPDDAEAAGFLDRSGFLAWLLALAAGVYLVRLFGERGLGALDINTVNVSFFALGLALHGSLRSFGSAAARGVSYLHGIIIQFPLYAGIGAVIKDSGLAAAARGPAGGARQPVLAAAARLLVQRHRQLLRPFGRLEVRDRGALPLPRPPSGSASHRRRWCWPTRGAT